MFERYTESARRTLFFARYEASQQGSESIEPEHILAGLLRERAGIPLAVLKGASTTPGQIRTDLELAIVTKPKLSTSVEIPFSPPVKRILQFAAEEADRLTHRYIGTEHLLLALLREEKTVAWDVLTKRGLSLTDARNKVVESLDRRSGEAEDGKTGLARDDMRTRVLQRINEIRLMLDELERDLEL